MNSNKIEIALKYYSRYLIYIIIAIGLFLAFFLFLPFGKAYADTPQNETVYHIFPQSNISKNLDIDGQHGYIELQIWIYQENNTVAQGFKLVSAGNSGGYNWFYIINIGTDMALDVRNGQCFMGAVVQQYHWNYTDAQKWAFISTSNAYGYTFYRIVPKLNPNLCLDVTNGGTDDYSKCYIWENNGNWNQRFGFNSVNGIAWGDLYSYHYSNGHNDYGLIDNHFFVPFNISSAYYFDMSGRISTNISDMYDIHMMSTHCYRYSGGKTYYPKGAMLTDCVFHEYFCMPLYPLIVNTTVYNIGNNGNRTLYKSYGSFVYLY